LRLRHLHHDAGSPKINVTPLIDVIMVLIIFYLIVGKLAQDRSGQVQLPVSTLGSPTSDAGLVIAAGLENQGQGALYVTVDGATIAISELESLLKDRLPELRDNAPQRTPVSLRADRRLTYAQLLPILDACKRAGVSSLQMIAGKGSSP
jgi:biopolymer transport protein ExbD